MTKRLIDANALKEYIFETETTEGHYLYELDMAIDNQPTACDLDKIVLKLEEIADTYDFPEQGVEDVPLLDFEHTKTIVLGGGIDD